MWLREHKDGAGHNYTEPTTQPFTCTHKHGHEVLFCGCVSYKEARSQCADGSPEDTQKDPSGRWPCSRTTRGREANGIIKKKSTPTNKGWQVGHAVVPMWLREHNSGAGHNIIEPTTQPFTCTLKHGHEVLFCVCVSYKEARSQCADGSPEDTQKSSQVDLNQGLFPTSCLNVR